ncbi:hypothetical protein JAO78_005365 [Alishewanella sp. 16-MA]|uniref:Uncharacterized protein n=2 Tax=Gammaproteobacteria TaxID=1236 RepID=A0ABS8C1P0_9ALTE|nr:hypothetical protein [Alishewanella maricola]MCB5226241.1 hypothetical protein [Alishewanella maricola]
MKELAYKVASGQIENPKVTLEVDGEKQVFEWREAKVFCFGYLTGLKASKNPPKVDDRTVNGGE